eukprot:4557267-Prymnesium_polylepis.1
MKSDALRSVRSELRRTVLYMCTRRSARAPARTPPASAGGGAPHDVAFHYPRWTIALWGIISNAYNAFKCTQTHHTTA